MYNMPKSYMQQDIVYLLYSIYICRKQTLSTCHIMQIVIMQIAQNRHNSFFCSLSFCLGGSKTIKSENEKKLLMILNS